MLRTYFSRTHIVLFKCKQASLEKQRELENLTFLSGLPFCSSPSSWEEVQKISREHEKLLVLGLFSWSNYSRRVIRDIFYHKDWFVKAHIGLAAFCPERSLTQLPRIMPEYDTSLNPATSEPFMFLVENGSLKKVRFGSLDALEILKWVLL